MSPSQLQESRRLLVDVSDAPAGQTPQIALLFRTLPALTLMLDEARDAYLQLRRRYAEDGPSTELSAAVLETAGNLGAVLQALRREQVWVDAMLQNKQKLIRSLRPPLGLLDELHHSLILLTGDAADTLAVAIEPEQLDRLLASPEVRDWRAAVQEWQRRAAAG